MTDAFRERLAAALAATYRIDDELIGGGMSRVFAATESALGRKVVIKVLPPELSAGVNRERFQREIQVAAQLQHPHIVPLLAAGRIPSSEVTGAPGSGDGELLYYTMPYIEGESLKTALARRGRFPVRDVVRILHDVVEALAYAHARGVVHRDIKPGNILTLGSHALVTDFGVAKALSAAMPVSGMTSGGVAIGTPAYMAPEQLAADPNADHRIDIYAVGLLAYELLSGKSPFVGTSPQATLAAQLTHVPEPLDAVRDDVPPALSAVITRCLEKLPEHRLPSADALLDALDGVQTPSGGATPSMTAATLRVAAAGHVPAVQRRALVAGALLVVIAGAAVALGTWRRVGANVTVSGPAVPPAPAPPAGLTDTAGVVAPRLSRDSAARTPIELTPAESLAIAEAVRKRLAARRDSQLAKGERALGDSLTRSFERALSDSITRIVEALRAGRRTEFRGFDPKEIERFRELSRLTVVPNVPAMPQAAPAPGVPSSTADPQVILRRAIPPMPPPRPGVRRVLVTAPRTSIVRRDLSGVGPAALDSLRRAIAARPGYEVLDAAMLRDARGTTLRARANAARSVGAGAVLMGLYYPRGESRMVLQLQVFDVKRNRIAGVVESELLDRDDPLRGLDALAMKAMAVLDAVEWPAPAADSGAPAKP